MVAAPPAEVVTAALDVVDLAARAAVAGLATPRTEPATPEALAAWAGPLVVKCRVHWQPQQRHELRIEARRFPGVTAALPRIRALAAGSEPVLQEPVDGGLEALVGLCSGGRPHGVVHQRSPGLWPTPSGVTSRAVTVTPDAGLVRGAERLLGGLGWSGLVELQFLRDRTGTAHLVDLNGRFYGSMALALAAGEDLVDLWGRQVLGKPLPVVVGARPGVRFLCTAGDVRRAVAERRGGLVTDLASVARWFPGAVTSVWDPHDVGPTLDLVRERLLLRRRPASTTAAGRR